VLLETLDISVSHSCAWTWIRMAIVCACVGRDLYLRVSGGFFLKDTSVRVWKLFVLLIAMGMILT